MTTCWGRATYNSSNTDFSPDDHNELSLASSQIMSEVNAADQVKGLSRIRSSETLRRSLIGGDHTLESEDVSSITDILKHVNQPIDSFYWLMSSTTFWVQQVPCAYDGKTDLQVAIQTTSPLYEIFNERGNCVFKAVNQENFRGRTESPFRSFKFNVVDSAGIPFMDIVKHRHTFWDLFSRWCPCWCFGPIKNEATIVCLNGNVKWVLKQEFTYRKCARTYFKAYKAGSDRVDVNIEGPGDICALGYPHGFTDGSESSRFVFKDGSNSDEVVAMARKVYPLGKWPAQYNTCPLAIIFTDKAELKHRIVAFGCAFLFDFMFFQKELH